MTTALSPILVSRLEKAATDNGFDQALEPEGDWLVVASTQCPLRVWLGAFGDAVLLAAFSQRNVACAGGRRRQDSPQPKWRFSCAQRETSAQFSGQLAPDPAGFGFQLGPRPQAPYEGGLTHAFP